MSEQNILLQLLKEIQEDIRDIRSDQMGHIREFDRLKSAVDKHEEVIEKVEGELKVIVEERKEEKAVKKYVNGKYLVFVSLLSLLSLGLTIFMKVDKIKHPEPTKIEKGK